MTQGQSPWHGSLIAALRNAAPERYDALVDQGTLEKTIEDHVEAAKDRYVDMIAAGADPDGAREICLREAMDAIVGLDPPDASGDLEQPEQAED